MSQRFMCPKCSTDVTASVIRASTSYFVFSISRWPFRKRKSLPPATDVVVACFNCGAYTEYFLDTAIRCPTCRRSFAA